MRYADPGPDVRHASLASDDWPAERAVESAIAREREVGVLADRAVQASNPAAPGVYILTYHSIVESGHEQPWELAYAGVRTSLEHFREHLGLLRREMSPVR